MIETARLLLRPHRPEDLDGLHGLTASPEARRFLSGAGSIEDSYARLWRSIGGWAGRGYDMFAMIERGTGRYVGNGGLFHMVREIDGEALEATEAGWVVAPERWGLGYATEAMTAAQAWFDAEHGPTRTGCMIVPGNAPSERLAARLGYRPFRRGLHKGVEVQLYERTP